MRLLVRSGVYSVELNLLVHAQIFMGNDTRSGHTENLYAIQDQLTASQINFFPQQVNPLRRKDNASQGASLHLQAMLVLPLKRYSEPQPGWGIVTSFPFGNGDKISSHTNQMLALGTSNPCPNAVHMETISSSAFKILIWILATSTKICTMGQSTQAHAHASYQTHTKSYTSSNTWRLRIGHPL